MEGKDSHFLFQFRLWISMSSILRWVKAPLYFRYDVTTCFQLPKIKEFQSKDRTAEPPIGRGRSGVGGEGGFKVGSEAQGCIRKEDRKPKGAKGGRAEDQIASHEYELDVAVYRRRSLAREMARRRTSQWRSACAKDRPIGGAHMQLRRRSSSHPLGHRWRMGGNHP